MATRTATAKSALRRPSNIATLVGLLGLLAVPILFPTFQVSNWTNYLIFALLAISVDLVWGYTGLLTLGHAAFFGAGAYLTAKLLKEVPAIPDPVVIFLLGPVFAAVITFLIGWFLFSADVKGSYFAITTLIVSVVFESIATEFVGFLGGFNGIYGIPSMSIGGFELSVTMNYYLVLGILVLLYIGSQMLVGSAFGRVLRGIRGNQERTDFFGYDTQRYRLIVFTISGAIAGLAGAMYATADGFVSPPLVGFILSTEVVIWVAVGGRGTLIGAVVGAILIQFLNNELSNVLVNFWQMGLALLFILVVLAAPRGLTGFAQDLVSQVKTSYPGRTENILPGGDRND